MALMWLAFAALPFLLGSPTPSSLSSKPYLAARDVCNGAGRVTRVRKPHAGPGDDLQLLPTDELSEGLTATDQNERGSCKPMA